MIKRSKHLIVQSTKDIQGGEPVFYGTRVPVKALIDYLKAGDRVDDFLQDFPSVSKDQVLDLLESTQHSIAKR